MADVCSSYVSQPHVQSMFSQLWIHVTSVSESSCHYLHLAIRCLAVYFNCVCIFSIRLAYCDPIFSFEFMIYLIPVPRLARNFDWVYGQSDVSTWLVCEVLSLWLAFFYLISKIRIFLVKFSLRFWSRLILFSVKNRWEVVLVTILS